MRLGSDDAAPSADADGVRIVDRSSRWMLGIVLLLVTIALVLAGIRWWTQKPMAAPQPRVVGTAVEPSVPAPSLPQTAPAPAPPASEPISPRSPLVSPNPADWRTGDANDIATYVSPGDPEPTAGELIQALRASGETGGIAAFNPPGTSPPLVGLAVPPDFPLPEGYVRHHQVTDEGEPIEPILMFSPDYVFRGANGQPIAIPQNRVVPPELAPPGLPIRHIQIPVSDPQ
jgi:hypothetical protein